MAKRRQSPGREEWAALVKDETPVKPITPATNQFRDGDPVAYRGSRYVVLFQNGNWVRVVEGGESGETFMVHADLLTLIRTNRTDNRDGAMDEKEAIRKTAAADPRATLREDVKQRVKQILDGVTTRTAMLEAIQSAGYLDDELKEYIDELDWGVANVGIMRMRVGNVLRGRMMKL